jgi:hypothetical protein
LLNLLCCGCRSKGLGYRGNQHVFRSTQQNIRFPVSIG